MKNIIFAILSFILLFSCTSYNESKNLNIESAQIAHSKFTNINNNLSYQEYKSLIVDYGKNSKFPDISK
jgi:enhancing lycopene biosynthesis protein 2